MEIKYMEQHDIRKVDIVILNDTQFYKELKDRFVYCYYADGLTNKDAWEVWRLFKNK